MAGMRNFGFVEWIRVLGLGSYLGGPCIDWCVFLIWIMSTVSPVISVVLNVRAVLMVEMKARMEANMMKIISLMCVVAGTALLGRSGDVFPMLQGSARIDVGPAV